MVNVIRCNSENADFKELVSLLDADLNGRNGHLQAQYNQFNVIDFIETVVVAYNDDIPVGCSCFKQLDDERVELKRMYVKPQQRGNGVATLILNELEGWAKEQNFKNMVLETGLKQPEAISLYQKFGFERIENYGQYIGNDNSVCFCKSMIIK